MSILKGDIFAINDVFRPFLVRQWRGLMLGLPPVVNPRAREELRTYDMPPVIADLPGDKNESVLSPPPTRHRLPGGLSVAARLDWSSHTPRF